MKRKYEEVKYVKFFKWDLSEKNEYNVNLEPKISDNDTLVDIQKFRLVPYIKYLIDPRHVINLFYFNL